MTIVFNFQLPLLTTCTISELVKWTRYFHRLNEVPEPLLFHSSSSSRGWVDTVLDRLLLRKFGSAGNQPRTSGVLATNSDHLTTEALSKIEINDRGDPLPWPRDTLRSQKFALTSSPSGDRSVGIIPLRTEATEFSFKWDPWWEGFWKELHFC
jgi:hypothetical protein